jgi:hypothetical protein
MGLQGSGRWAEGVDVEETEINKGETRDGLNV